MTPRDRRALVWGAVAIVGATILLRGVPWARGIIGRVRERALTQAEMAEQARALLATRGMIQDSLRQVLAAVVALAPQLVEGRSSVEAGATLSGLVSLAASRHGLKVVRLDPLPDSALGVFQRAEVHVELEGDAAGVVAVLKAIETSALLLSVESLGITAGDPFAARTAPELLRVEMDVSGLYLARGVK